MLEPCRLHPIYNRYHGPNHLIPSLNNMGLKHSSLRDDPSCYLLENRYHRHYLLRPALLKGQVDLRYLGRLRNHRGPTDWLILYRILVAKVRLHRYLAYRLRHRLCRYRLSNHHYRGRTEQ